jgi:hypothetical protein
MARRGRTCATGPQISELGIRETVSSDLSFPTSLFTPVLLVGCVPDNTLPIGELLQSYPSSRGMDCTHSFCLPPSSPGRSSSMRQCCCGRSQSPRTLPRPQSIRSHSHSLRTRIRYHFRCASSRALRGCGRCSARRQMNEGACDL